MVSHPNMKRKEIILLKKASVFLQLALQTHFLNNGYLYNG